MGWPALADDPGLSGLHLLELAIQRQADGGYWIVLRGCDKPVTDLEMARRIARGTLKELRHNGHPILPVVREA